jgi:fatty-acyl-CoA synthase
MLIDPVSTYGRARPDALACFDLATQQGWSYAELDRAVNRMSNWLIAAHGPGSGARIASLARNSADLLVAFLGCARAGAIYVPLNWRLTPVELSMLAEDSGAICLIRDSEFSVPGFKHDQFDLLEFRDTLSHASPAAPSASARRDFEETSLLLYTSGTSGRPKGVMLSEANIYWGCTNFIHGNGVSQDSVFLCDMPMFHTAGLNAAVRTPILAGGTVLISPGFDPEMTLSRLGDRELGITHYFSVPQMAQAMWNLPGFNPEVLRGLKVYATGGAPNPAVQIKRFATAGIPMSDGFGMSETGSNFGMPVDDMELVISKAGSCGLPYIAIEVRIVDTDGRDLPDGVPGELWLRGPSVAKGYWNQPEVTANAFQDSWFKTGDIAMRDQDGFYFLVDRKKDMFISGGENVYPAEVEAAITELAGVAEVAVIGVPDLKWGEVGRAYVTPVAGNTLTAEDILTYCKTRLAGYKSPKSVVLTDAIPRTASGKVQKHLLQDRARQEMSEDPTPDAR